jgi:hypothetical protein
VQNEDLKAWLPLLMRMTQVSLVGYAAGGAFLSLAYFDLPFYLFGYVVLCDRMVRSKVDSRIQTVATSSPQAAADRDPAATKRLPMP